MCSIRGPNRVYSPRERFVFSISTFHFPAFEDRKKKYLLLQEEDEELLTCYLCGFPFTCRIILIKTKIGAHKKKIEKACLYRE